MVYWKEIMQNPPKLNSITTRASEKVEPLFYDSETSKITHIEKKGKKEIEVVDDTWVYIWMVGIGDIVVYGRYLHEFIEFIQWVIDTYDISPDKTIDIWIHNESYDISYMHDLIFKFNGGSEGMRQICISRRHFIAFELENFGITFKCTYALTNRSLAQWCKDLAVKNVKRTGLKDYDAVYYPWDEDLPEEELIYAEYDIISMKECFYKECEVQGYDFKTIPLTQTGFVRRDFKARYTEKGSYKKNRWLFKQSQTTPDQYNRLLQASGGGMVQGNYRILNKTIYHEPGVGHVDFSSHYPVQIKTKLMPWKPYTVVRAEDCELSDLDAYYREGYYYVVDISLGGLDLREGVTAPFLCKSKVKAGPGAIIHDFNGKVISVTGGDEEGAEVRLTCTNFDLEIIREQYNFNWYYIYNLDIYTTRLVPGYIMDTLDKYYKDKTELKMQIKVLENRIDVLEDKIASVEGTEELEELEKQLVELNVHYNIAKQKLNGVFGCMDSRSVRGDIFIKENLEWDSKCEMTIDDYYKKWDSCCPMQVGVFVTALARYELYTVIKDVVGYDAFLYCDTDSAFYKSTPEIEKRVEEYRRWCREDSEKKDAYIILDSGDKVYYHDLSPEKDHLQSKTFRVLHAKCYALEPKGKLKCTIAGVAAKDKTGTITREEELGSIDNLKPGFRFIHCGGTRADYSTVRPYDGYSGGGCAIMDATKELSADFEDEVEGDLLYE